MYYKPTHDIILNIVFSMKNNFNSKTIQMFLDVQLSINTKLHSESFIEYYDLSFLSK